MKKFLIVVASIFLVIFVFSKSPLLGFALIIASIFFYRKSKAPANADVPTLQKIEPFEPSDSDYIALDFETTGLDRTGDQIIEVCALRFSSQKPVEKFCTLINPKRKIPLAATNVNGISNSMVRGMPTIEKVLPDLMDFIGDLPLVAHNARFDIDFLEAACARFYRNSYFQIQNKIIDTLSVSRLFLPDLENHKLGTVAKALNIDIQNAHRAEFDAYAAGMIYSKYLDFIEARKKERVESLSEIEKNILEIVKATLLKNDRSLDYIGCGKTSKYFDVVACCGNMIRCKLDGKKSYAIFDLPTKEILKFNKVVEIEPCAKSEKGECRIILNEVDDLLKVESLIVSAYDAQMSNIDFKNKDMHEYYYSIS